MTAFQLIAVRVQSARLEPPEKKRTRGSKTTGPVAAIDVWVFGGGEQPLKRIEVYGVVAGSCPRRLNHTLGSAFASTLFF